jgi:heterotetrameric sarcosine oxidase gamma subunit
MTIREWKFDTPLQQAGLTNSVHETNGNELRLLTSISLLRLHSLQTRADLNSNLRSIDLDLPQFPNQASGQDPAVLCLAPSDWLLFGEHHSARELQQLLKDRISPGLTTLTNLSSAFAVFRLSGNAAPWLLAKNCGLDFRKGMASGQHCCRTGLSLVPAILHYHQPGSSSPAFVFDILIERSLAAYTWQLLLRQFPHAMEAEQLHGPFYQQDKPHP